MTLRGANLIFPISCCITLADAKILGPITAVYENKIFYNDLKEINFNKDFKYFND